MPFLLLFFEMWLEQEIIWKHDECQRANGIKLIAFSFILIKLFIAKVSLLCQSSVEGAFGHVHSSNNSSF